MNLRRKSSFLRKPPFIAALTVVLLTIFIALEFRILDEFHSELTTLDSARKVQSTTIQFKHWLRAAVSAQHAFVITKNEDVLGTVDEARHELASLLNDLGSQFPDESQRIAQDTQSLFDSVDHSIALSRQSPQAFESQLSVTYLAEDALALIQNDLDAIHVMTATRVHQYSSVDGASRNTLEIYSLVGLVMTVLLVIYAYVALLFEIRNRKRAEMRIRGLSSDLVSMINSHPLPVITRDNEDKIIHWNQKAEMEFQRATDEIIITQEAIETAQSKDELLLCRKLALTESRVSTVEIIAGRADGSVFDAIATISPFRDQLGHIKGTVTIYSDISELIQSAAEKIQLLVSQREAIMQEVNHTVKNNLQAVANMVHQQLHPFTELNDVRKKLTTQLYAIAAIHGLRGRRSRGATFANIVSEISDIVKLLFGEPIHFTNELGDSRRKVIAAEAIPVTLVITELLTNAIKHSDSAERGRFGVKVRIFGCGDDIAIEVINKGKLVGDLQFPGGADLGDGLRLSLALLPRVHSELQLSAADGIVCARLTLCAALLESHFATETEHAA